MQDYGEIMNWTKEAENAVSRVPFFVRRRVKKRIEQEHASQESTIVTIDHVEMCRKRYLEKMEDEVKGYQIETCFGPSGCPNRACADDDFADLVERNTCITCVRDTLKTKVKGPLKLHHEFRVSISDCPNACSRPQIADIGIIGAARPDLKPELCSSCGVCAHVCSEGAIVMGEHGAQIDDEKCLGCGKCMKSCPSGALETVAQGYRVMVGGKLGRRPQLARELGGLHSKSACVSMIDKCISHYLENNEKGERFGEALNRIGIDNLEKKFEKK
jgi:anaerobic sulfite reductase subunit C